MKYSTFVLRMGVQESCICGSAQFCGKPHIHVCTPIVASNLRLNAAPHCAAVQAVEALRWFKTHRFTLTPDCVTESDLHTKLQKLSSPVGSLNVAEMAPHLGTLTSLQILILSDNGIGEEGAKSLAPHLATLASLHELRVVRNGIEGEGAKALAPHLATLTSLQKLDLNRNSIGDEGAKGLAPHIATLTSLQELLLGYNGIGDKGVKALARHLATLTSLKDLYLDKSNITFLAKMKVRVKMFGLRTLEL